MTPMRVALAAALLASALATAEQAPAPIKIAAPGLTGLNVDAREVDYFTTQLVQQLTLEGVEVSTPSEIGALLGLERQKQLLGCSDSSESCIAEIAGALNADGVVVGTIGRFGETFQLDVKIVSTQDAKPLAVYSTRAEGQDGLLGAMPAAAGQLAKQLSQKLGRAVVSKRTGSGGALKKAAIPVLVVGGVAAVGGGALLFQSERRAAELGSGSLTLDQARETRDAGLREQRFGSIALGVGLAAVAAGALMLAFGGGESQTVSFVPLRDGAALAIVGALP